MPMVRSAADALAGLPIGQTPATLACAAGPCPTRRMITLHKRRDLTLAAGSAPGRPSYLSAASGLVYVQSRLYVIADDEHHLGVFGADHVAPGTLIELIPGALPKRPKPRKKQKPDFEALVRLPPFGPYPHGALLASGSGSRPNRMRGVILGLGHQGEVRGTPRTIDLSWLLGPLTSVCALNIEGMSVLGDELWLFQRGNKGDSFNAVFRFSLADALERLLSAQPAALDPYTTVPVDLGAVDGVPLSFTDAAALPTGEVVFSAVAEDTDDSYRDGACVGTALGVLSSAGELRWVDTLEERHKVEGIHATLTGRHIDLLLVTDADDIEIPAGLYAASVAAA
jgi:hypothetical protein